MRPRWDSPELQVASDSKRTRRFRLLQSWYRETVLDAEPGQYQPKGREARLLGSLLRPGDAAEGRNFLDPRIHSYAIERAETVQAENGTMETHRLLHNMLSSMPLCFNVFGLVRALDSSDQLELVRMLFDPLAERVEMIECEWTPVRSSINDRTAFDATIVTTRAGGRRHLIGVEAKYTEPFSQTRYGARENDAGKYRSVHDESGWFDSGAHDLLTAPATNQLWRNCLLAASTELSGEFDSASIAVMCVRDDPGAIKALNGVCDAMTDPLRCLLVPLDEVVSRAQTIPNMSEWAIEFERRYVDLSPIS